MEKSYHQWTAFQHSGVLTGKTQELIGSATGEQPGTVVPTDFANQYLTGPEQALVEKQGGVNADLDSRKKALAYAHQWKGSGPGQRGLSLDNMAVTAPRRGA